MIEPTALDRTKATTSLLIHQSTILKAVPPTRCLCTVSCRNPVHSWRSALTVLQYTSTPVYIAHLFRFAYSSLSSSSVFLSIYPAALNAFGTSTNCACTLSYQLQWSKYYLMSYSIYLQYCALLPGVQLHSAPSWRLSCALSTHTPYSSDN